MKFQFNHLKLRKQPFFAKNLIEKCQISKSREAPRPSKPHPSDVHVDSSIISRSSPVHLILALFCLCYAFSTIAHFATISPRKLTDLTFGIFTDKRRKAPIFAALTQICNSRSIYHMLPTAQLLHSTSAMLLALDELKRSDINQELRQ